MTTRFDFRLSENQLCEVTRLFLERFEFGLQQDNTEIKCLPTFIPVDIPVDKSTPSGDAYVLDLGGSNLRAAYVSLKHLTVSAPLAKEMPWQRGQPFDKFRYLDEQAKLLAALPQSRPAPLGYCFSYPAASEPDGDARLIRWTKGVVVPDTVGELVGASLLNHLEQHYQRHFTRVAVVNDTVTSLLAGLTLKPMDVYAGLIAGTGTNVAALIKHKQIPKLSTAAIDQEQRLPVNLESGNYSPPHLTEWDEELDRTSENPGEQRMEKAVAGLYLGRLFSLANPDLNFEPESGARGLVEFIQTTSDMAARESALSLYHRSAQLVAAKLAGLAQFYCTHYQARSMRVVAEGGLAWSAIDQDTRYHFLVVDSLQQLLTRLGLQHLHVEIIRVDQANLIGAAVAAAMLNSQPLSSDKG